MSNTKSEPLVDLLRTQGCFWGAGKNNSPVLLVFASFCGVASTGTYPDMHRRMRLVDETKSGAIWWNYFFPPALIKFCQGRRKYHGERSWSGPNE
jgi:hypothetical protein